MSSRRRWRLGVKKVVYASSASVYGGADAFPTDERHHPYNNRTLYGAAKLMDEGIARTSATWTGWRASGSATSTSMGRGWIITGAYTEVFIRWLDCVDRGSRPQIHGDGSATMDFIFVDDIARANILAMESDREDDVYNVASGTETSLLGLWQAIQQVTGAHHLDARVPSPAEGQPGPPAAGGCPASPRRAGLSSPRFRLRKDCARRGGAAGQREAVADEHACR